MKLLGNIIWWIFGGIESAIAYFTGSCALCLTIVGIPFALQGFKLCKLTLFPFGSTITKKADGNGCLNLFMNILWIITGGFWAFCMHIFFGILLAITIIGIPFAKQHFKLAKLSLCPFGKEIN